MTRIIGQELTGRFLCFPAAILLEEKPIVAEKDSALSKEARVRLAKVLKSNQDGQAP